MIPMELERSARGVARGACQGEMRRNHPCGFSVACVRRHATLVKLRERDSSCRSERPDPTTTSRPLEREGTAAGAAVRAGNQVRFRGTVRTIVRAHLGLWQGYLTRHFSGFIFRRFVYNVP